MGEDAWEELGQDGASTAQVLTFGELGEDRVLLLLLVLGLGDIRGS